MMKAGSSGKHTSLGPKCTLHTFYILDHTFFWKKLSVLDWIFTNIFLCILGHTFFEEKNFFFFKKYFIIKCAKVCKSIFRGVLSRKKSYKSRNLFC